MRLVSCVLTQNDAAPKLQKTSFERSTVAYLPRMTLLQNGHAVADQWQCVAYLPRMTLLQNVTEPALAGSFVAYLPRMTLLQNRGEISQVMKAVAYLPRMTLLQNCIVLVVRLLQLRTYPE